MKGIIVYYSLEGNTRSAAEEIKKETGFDILEIKTEKDLPKGGLKFIVGGSEAVFGICPRLKPYKFDKDEYDEVILGTPIWAGKCAPAIRSFLKEQDVKDKVNAVFTLSGSGNNDKCIRSFKKEMPGMRLSVSLYDKNSGKPEENDKRLRNFINKLK